MHSDLFATPISKTKVRNDVFAFKYANGCININGEKYFFYSIKDAIKNWRGKYPITGYDRWLNAVRNKA